MYSVLDGLDTAAAATDDWRELDNRTNAGLTVSLHWSESVDRVRVTVVDSKLDRVFDFEVPGAQAHEAFTHPFAYWAARGTDTTRRPHGELDSPLAGNTSSGAYGRS